MAVATRKATGKATRQPTQKRQVKKRSRLAGRRPSKSRHLTYRHHTGKNQGYIQYPRQCDGRRPQETFPGEYGSPESQAAYEKSLAYFLTHGTLPPWIKQSTPPPEQFEPQLAGVVTVAQLCREFMAAQGPGYRSSERAAFRVVIERLCSLHAAMPVEQFKRPKLRDVRQQMISRGNCRRYIDAQVTRIRGLFDWGVDEDLVPPEIAAGLKTLRRLKTREAHSYPEVEPVADAVVAQTLPNLPPEAADLVRLLRLTGARPSELMDLKACDIIQTRDDLWEYHLAEHKTAHKGHQRCIYFGPRAIKILERLIEQRGQRSVLLVQPDWQGIKNRHSWEAGKKLLAIYQQGNWQQPATQRQPARQPRVSQQPRKRPGTCGVPTYRKETRSRGRGARGFAQFPLVGDDGRTHYRQRTFPGAYNSAESLAAYHTLVDYWTQHGALPQPPKKTSWKEYLTRHSRELVGLSPARAQTVLRRAKQGVERPRTKAGQPWNASRLAQLIQRTCEKHGIEHWTPYQLRHAAACQAVQNGSLAATQRMLGHKLATTTDHYVKGDPDGAARLVAQLG